MSLFICGEVRRVNQVEKEFNGNKYTRISIKLECENYDCELVCSKKMIESEEYKKLEELIGEKLMFNVTIQNKIYKEKIYTTYYISKLPVEKIEL